VTTTVKFRVDSCPLREADGRVFQPRACAVVFERDAASPHAVPTVIVFTGRTVLPGGGVSDRTVHETIELLWGAVPLPLRPLVELAERRVTDPAHPLLSWTEPT